MADLRRVGGALVVTLFAASAQASIVEFTNRAAWTAATGGAAASENFNSFTTDALFGLSNPVNLNGGMVLASLVDSSSLNDNAIDAAPLFSSEHNVDGTSDARVFNGQSGTPLTPLINFGIPVTGFGADFRNLNDDILRTQIELYSGASLLTTLTPSIEPFGTLRFWGFASNSGELITQLRFTRVDNDVFGMDNIDIAYTTPVPEPATMTLLGAGLVVLRARRRRP